MAQISKKTASLCGGAGLAILLALAGCGEQKDETANAAFDPTTIPLSDPDLQAGQTTWGQTCATCHLSGLTGAPIIGNKAAWEPRIAKGLETLYDHALNGFIGPDYTEMPPKGGYSELSDEHVKQAVRFMTHLSQ